MVVARMLAKGAITCKFAQLGVLTDLHITKEQSRLVDECWLTCVLV